ncbi:hypothetical protein [Cellulomonas sp. Y8]|uniref:hypothetical protein n=1 Tax=Cellulomonas sp. Y8 TaxID=2591145 RepID=UPI003D732BA8
MARRRRALVLGALGTAFVVAVMVWHPWARSAVPPRGSAEHTPAETDGPVHVPAITWPYGTPDDGPWADDQWVLALRRYDLLASAAEYRHNYSDPRLATFAPQSAIQGSAQKRAAELRRALDPDDPAHRPVEYFPGPRPQIILDVAPDDLGATIRVCVPETWGAASAEDVHDPPRTGITARWSMYRADSEIWPSSFGHEIPPGGGTTPCDLSRVRFGYFDPAPPYGEAVDPGAVIGPDGTPVAPVSSGTGSA